MVDLCRLIWDAFVGLFRSRASLEAEIVALRHQLNILRRKSPKRPILGNIDRLVFARLYGLAPGVLSALAIVSPETVIRWHRAGFRSYWRLRSRSRGGRPKTPPDVGHLIRDISVANPLWGAPRIHGELLKLGIDVGQTTVAKYMARGRRPPSQGWKTFLRNHADGIASMDLFVVPTISFQLLYGLLILRHGRREILWLGATTHLSAEWISRQLTEAYGWEQGYVISFAIGTASTAMSLSGFFGRWAFGIGRPPRDHHGRMAIVKGSSARSDGTALITLLYLVSSI
jgi:hypothetical protein